MILRRIIAHFRKQEWTAIALMAAVRGNFGDDIAILEDALEALRAAQ
jgi:hypothetical protein